MRGSSFGAFGCGLLLAAVGTALLAMGHNTWAPPGPDRSERGRSVDSVEGVARSAVALLDGWADDIRQFVKARQQPAGTAGAGLAVVSVPIGGEAEHGEDASVVRLVRYIQTELQRVGCYGGRVHGAWDQATRGAVTAFAAHAGVRIPVSAPGYATLTLLQGQNGSACPSVCRAHDPSDCARDRAVATARPLPGRWKFLDHSDPESAVNGDGDDGEPRPAILPPPPPAWPAAETSSLKNMLVVPGGTAAQDALSRSDAATSLDDAASSMAVAAGTEPMRPPPAGASSKPSTLPARHIRDQQNAPARRSDRLARDAP